MKIGFKNPLGNTLKNKIEGYQFEVGVLQDAPHMQAVDNPLFGDPPLKQYAGGPARKQTRKPSGQSIGQVLVANMQRLNLNLLSEPFQKESSELVRFTHAFLKTALAKASLKRVENLLQAVVRNPILRQEYGTNKASTADGKGFDRHLIDTAQTFKAIRARARRV
jgi:hypothetical protein